MTRTEKYDCVRCDRKFLSENQLRRHYDRNPTHRKPVTLDARAVTQEVQTLPDSEWVDFDDRVETFLQVAEGTDPHELEFRYHPDEARVTINGAHGERQTLDVSDMQAFASATLQWSFGGEYLQLAFLKRG